MQENWERLILQIIYDLGGNANLQQIYEALMKGNYIKLSERQLAKSYGRPSFHHEVRSFISNLKDQGCVKKIERANYEITPIGESKIRL